MLDLKNKEREREREEGGNGWGSDWALRSGKRKRHRRGCNKNRLPRCDKKFTKRPSGSPRQTKRILSTVPESSTLLTSTKPSSPPLSLYVSREREREKERVMNLKINKIKEKETDTNTNANTATGRERERERERCYLLLLLLLLLLLFWYWYLGLGFRREGLWVVDLKGEVDRNHWVQSGATTQPYAL